MSPDIEASWFVDPPYQDKGKWYRHGSEGIDYQNLADWCSNLKGQIIVCENFGAEWLPFEYFASQVGHSKDGNSRKISKEVVWVKDC